MADPRSQHANNPKRQPGTAMDADGLSKIECSPMSALITRRMCGINQGIAEYARDRIYKARNPGRCAIASSRFLLTRIRACGLCPRCESVTEADVSRVHKLAIDEAIKFESNPWRIDDETRKKARKEHWKKWKHIWLERYGKPRPPQRKLRKET